MSFPVIAIIVPATAAIGGIIGYALHAAQVLSRHTPLAGADGTDASAGEPMSEAVAAIEQDIDAPDPEPALPDLDPETARALLDHVPKLSSPYCLHCGGLHAPPCPRVRRMIGNPLPDVLMEVEYWPEGRWDRSGIMWPEDLSAIVAAAPVQALTPEVEE